MPKPCQPNGVSPSCSLSHGVSISSRESSLRLRKDNMFTENSIQTGSRRAGNPPPCGGTGQEVLSIQTENETVNSGMPLLPRPPYFVPPSGPERVTWKESHLERVSRGRVIFSCNFHIFPCTHQRLCNHGSAFMRRSTCTPSQHLTEVPLTGLPPISMRIPVNSALMPV
jgi:hypothetical protein